MDGNCHSRKHYWLDPVLASYCCDPNYQEVRAISRRELEQEGAVAIRPIAQGLMYAGWVCTQGKHLF